MSEIHEQSYLQVKPGTGEFLIKTDEDFLIVNVNDLLITLSGRKRHELIGMPVTQLLSNVPKIKFHSPIDRKTPSPFYISALFPVAEGNLITTHWLVSAYKDDPATKGNGFYWIGCRGSAEDDYSDGYLYQQELIQQVSDIIISINLEGRIITWNRAAEELYGYTADEVKNKPLDDFINYRYINDNLSHSREELFKKGNWRGEVIYTRKDGAKFHLFCSASLLKDAEGTTYGIVAVNRNITDQKSAEREIKESEARFRTLTENAPIIIWRLNTNLQCIYVNPAFEKTYGLKADHVMGKTPAEAGLTGEPLKKFMEAASILLAEKQPQAIYIDIPKKDLSTLYLHTSLHPEFVQNRLDSILVISHDVTDLRKKEEELKWKEAELSSSNQRFSLAMRATTDGIWELNLKSGHIYISEEFVNKFGYTVEELKSQSADWYIRKICPTDSKRVVKNLRDIFSLREPFWRDEFYFLCKDNSYKYILQQASILYDDAGNPEKMIGATHDLTLRKEAEAALINKEKLFAAIAAAASDLISKPDAERVIQDNLKLIAKAAELDRVSLVKYLFDEEKGQNYLSLSYEWCSDASSSTGNEKYLSNIRSEEVLALIQSMLKNQVCKATISGLENYWLKAHLQSRNVKSMLSVPIFTNGQFWGAVSFQQCTYERAWKNTEIDIFKTFVFTLSAAIEKNEAYRKLQDSEEKFKALFRNSVDIVFVLDEELLIRYVTPSIEKQLGFDDNELKDAPWLTYIHPEDIYKIEAALRSLAKNNNHSLLANVRYQNRQKEWKWMEVKGQNQLQDRNINGIVVSLRDITERQNAQQELKAYSERIAAILNSITDGFAVIDQDYHVTVWNRIAEKLTGIQTDLIVGKNIWEEIPGLTETALPEETARALSEKITLHVEQYFTPVDQWFDISLYPYQEGLFVYFKDITEKKKQEMLLALEKNVLEMNSSADVTLRSIVDYYLLGIEKINPGVLCSVLLLEENKMMHLSGPSLPSSFLNTVNGLEIGPRVGSCGTAMYRKEKVIVSDIETDPLWKEHNQLPLSYNLRACWSIPILSSQEKVIGSFASYYMEPRVPGKIEVKLIERTANLLGVIIESKKAEEQVRISNERYLLATRAANEAIWDWDLKKDIVYWGEGINALFGYPSGNTKSNLQLWNQNLHPEDRDKVVKALHTFIENKSSHLWIDEYRFRKADGSYAIVHDKGYLICDSHGEPVRMVGSIEDVTEKKRLEKKLIKQEIDKQKLIAQAIVEAQEKERAEIGKELHDNVNQILSTAKLLLEVAKTNTKERPKLIKRSAEQIHHAINEIRNISRSLVPPSISDLGLVESIKDLLENITVTKRLKADFTSVGDIENGINNNQKLMLFRIIQEQISNILRHSEARHFSIKLSVNNIGIELVIEDNGKGFDPENIKAKKGVGLSNIASRVELFNGKVNIISSPGHGCRLVVEVVPIKILNKP